MKREDFLDSLHLATRAGASWIVLHPGVCCHGTGALGKDVQMNDLPTEIRSLALATRRYKQEAVNWERRTHLAVTLLGAALVAVFILFMELRWTRAALTDCNAGFEVTPFYDVKEKP